MTLRFAVPLFLGLLPWGPPLFAEPVRTIQTAYESGAEPARLVGSEEFVAEFDVTASPESSPDGTKVAFDGWRGSRGESNQHSRVFVADFGGSDVRDLGDGAMPTWSADGKKFAFTRYSPNYGVWVMNVDGTEKQLLDDQGWSAQWSPDGKTIAYAVYKGSRADLCLYDVKTKAKRFVFEGNGPAYGQIYWNFCWSPDSGKLCFKGSVENEFELATVSVDGPAAHFHVHHRGGEFDSDIAWHPDGERIVFAAKSPAHGDRYRLYTVRADGSAGLAPLPGLPDEYEASNPDFSADGKLLLFAGRRAPEP